MELLSDLINYALARKKLWLLPIIAALLLTALLILAASTGTAVAPIIYTVF